ncbi:MAG: hypothetical protein ACLU3U_01540 [Gallintestinimicrobium sp.]
MMKIIVAQYGGLLSETQRQKNRLVQMNHIDRARSFETSAVISGKTIYPEPGNVPERPADLAAPSNN